MCVRMCICVCVCVCAWACVNVRTRNTVKIEQQNVMINNSLLNIFTLL